MFAESVGSVDRIDATDPQEADLTPEDMALEALKKATEADVKIEQHERVCAQRWGLVVKIGLVQLGAILTVLGTLLYDRFM